MTIRECVILEDDNETGVMAISYVQEPAFEDNFLFMDKDKVEEMELAGSEYYMYTAEPLPEIIETSHDFCKSRAGKIFHISEIRAWGGLNKKENGFIEESDFFATFDGSGSFNLDQQVYNCRHWLKKVKTKMAPEYKQKLFSEKTPLKSNFSFNFSEVDKEKHEVIGLAMKSGKLIYRHNVAGEPGYIYFTRDTIRKIFKKYGYNKTITIDHTEDIRVNDVIMLKSFLEEDDEKNETRWIVQYKVVSQELWEKIKSKEVRGFSVEINVRLK
jgi:hypothetical protein